MIFWRRNRYKAEIRQAEERSDRALHHADENLGAARRIVERFQHAADDLEATREEDGFGEAVAASFEPRPKKKQQ